MESSNSVQYDASSHPETLIRKEVQSSFAITDAFESTIKQNTHKYGDENRKRRYVQLDTKLLADCPGEEPRKRRCPERIQAEYSVGRSNKHQQHERDVDLENDWRRFLCATLGTSTSITDDDLAAKLQDTLNEAGGVENSAADSGLLARTPQPFYKILHRVHCHVAGPSCLYSEAPFLSNNDDIRIGSHLTGLNQISDLDRYIERELGISFVAIREYECCDASWKINPMNSLIPVQDVLRFGSDSLCLALNRLRKMVPNGDDQLFPVFTCGEEYFRFHYAVYWHRDKLLKLAETEKEDFSNHLQCFLDYYRKEMTAEFREADMLFGQHMFTLRFLPYLFIPGEVFILNHTHDRDLCRGAQLASWPDITTTWSHRSKAKTKEGEILVTKIKLQVIAWEFDGNFKQIRWEIQNKIEWNVNEIKPISSMSTYPFNLADVGIQTLLKKRGSFFWKCRLRNYISYSGWDFHNQERFNHSRFLIDTRAQKAALKAMTIQQPNQKRPEDFPDELGPEVMECETPPGKRFILLLPFWMFGFNMNDKQWKLLLVSRMSDIIWDDGAFHNLVLPEDAKEVVKALVTYRISGSFSTDLIR